jgi:hypothetical protein
MKKIDFPSRMQKRKSKTVRFAGLKNYSYFYAPKKEHNV